MIKNLILALLIVVCCGRLVGAEEKIDNVLRALDGIASVRQMQDDIASKYGIKPSQHIRETEDTEIGEYIFCIADERIYRVDANTGCSCGGCIFATAVIKADGKELTEQDKIYPYVSGYGWNTLVATGYFYHLSDELKELCKEKGLIE